MSGREERIGYAIEAKRTQADIDYDLIDQLEAEARELVPAIRQILLEGGNRGKEPHCGFWVGKFFFTEYAKPGYRHISITKVCYKKRFLSAPVVLEYEEGGFIDIKVLKFKRGPWTEQLASASMLSTELLAEYKLKQYDEKIAKKLRKRKKRLRELGIDTDD